MKNRWSSWSVVGLAVALAAGGFFMLTVRHVRCMVNDHEVSAEFAVCNQLQTLRGSRLLLRDFQRDPTVATLLYDAHSQTGYDIDRSEKSLGGQVTLYLIDQPPLYRMEFDGQPALLSVQGSVRANNPQLSVPFVSDPNGFYQDEPERVHGFLSAFLSGLGEKRSRVTEITLESLEKVTVRLTGFPQVVLTVTQDPVQAAMRLVLLLDRLRPEEIDLSIRELDLRFELPVLRTFPSETAHSSSSAAIDSQE